LKKKEDERGYFARTFCISEFAQHEIDFKVVQANMSFSKKSGTIRGLHYQSDGIEAKLIRCTKGSIFDVVVDLRSNSSSYLQVSCNEISQDNQKLIYVPPGCAHGFLTLENNSEVSYMVSAPYAPEYENGLRYNDPILKSVKWPVPVEIVTKKDLSFKDFEVSFST
jgi:dTDP-4-dehydrorhamnose 3,5-epimerase